MEISTLSFLSVIFVVLCVILTLPNGSVHFANAQVTTRPGRCYGAQGLHAFDIRADHNAQGATRVPGTHSRDQCLNHCSNDASCRAVDYVRNSGRCWVFNFGVSTQGINSAPGIDHYTRRACNQNNTPVPATTRVPDSNLPECFSNSRFIKYTDTVQDSGQSFQANRRTLHQCLEHCADRTRSGTNGCYAVNWDTQAQRCYFLNQPSTANSRRTDSNRFFDHYRRTFCSATTTTMSTTTTTAAIRANFNEEVTFRMVFVNSFNDIANRNLFVATFRDYFCDGTAIRCIRLLRPLSAQDVINSRDYDFGDSGPPNDYTVVRGRLAPGNPGETITLHVMEDLEDFFFETFRAPLSNENGGGRLIPDESTAYNGFEWEPVDQPEDDDEDDEYPFGLKLEHWILIGLAGLALVVIIIAVIIICVCCQRNSESSDNRKGNARNERKERKRRREEEKRRAREEAKQRRDKDVEQGSEADYHSEPDVVPTRTSATSADDPGFSDEDKAY